MNQLKNLQIMHLAFCTSILVFAGVTLFVNMETLKFELSFSNEPIELLAPLITGMGLFISPFIFKQIIDRIEQNSDLSSKLVKYQTAFLVKCAFLESAALICIVACLITSNVLFMIFAALAFFSFWYAKPTKEKVSSTLQLRDSDLLNGI